MILISEINIFKINYHEISFLKNRPTVYQ